MELPSIYRPKGKDWEPSAHAQASVCHPKQKFSLPIINGNFEFNKTNFTLTECLVTVSLSQVHKTYHREINGGIFCPHLGDNYCRGNKYKGKHITQENAALLKGFQRNQIPSLLYDQSVKGFDPTTWSVCIHSTENARLYLQPFHGYGNTYSNLVHVHCSKNEEENNFLYHTTSKLIEERNPVRTTNGWNGVGIMVGIGEHLN
jgi:hypothetical protein